MPRQPSPACACVKTHRPPFFEGNRHHLVPQSWGGQTVPENLIDLCMNTHGNVHNGLNAITHLAWDVNGTGHVSNEQVLAALKPYPPYTRDLVMRAMVGVGGDIPHIYTQQAPTASEKGPQQ